MSSLGYAPRLIILCQFLLWSRQPLSFLENSLWILCIFIYHISFLLRNTNCIDVGSPSSVLQVYIFSWIICQRWFFYFVSYLFSSVCPYPCYCVFSQVYTLLCGFQCGLLFCDCLLISIPHLSWAWPVPVILLLTSLSSFISSCFPIKPIPSSNCFPIYLTLVIIAILYHGIFILLCFILLCRDHELLLFRWLVILKEGLFARARSSRRLSCLSNGDLKLFPLKILSTSWSGFLTASIHGTFVYYPIVSATYQLLYHTNWIQGNCHHQPLHTSSLALKKRAMTPTICHLLEESLSYQLFLRWETFIPSKDLSALLPLYQVWQPFSPCILYTVNWCYKYLLMSTKGKLPLFE